MQAALASTREAARFAFLILALLVLPAICGTGWLPSRQQAYASQSWGSGPYPWIEHAIFAEKGDIDILLIGSSHILHCLDARKVQERLSEELGRPAIVRVIGWGGAGFDALYFIARDVLERRNVGLLVFYNENNDPGGRNSKSPVWFRMADAGGSLQGLPLSERAYFYFAALVGMPRNLLTLLRPNLPADLQAPNYWEEHYCSANIATSLGSTASELGYDERPTGDVDPNIPFMSFVPTNGTSPEDVVVYGIGAEKEFEFLPEPLPVWQTHFARLLKSLAHKEDCRLVLLNIPTVATARLQKIREHDFWREQLDERLRLVVVPPARMFGGLTDEEVRKLYFNAEHLNKNGQDYFTGLITPTLLRLHAK